MRGEVLGAIFQDPMTSLNPTMRIGKQIGEVTHDDAESVRLLETVGVRDAQLRLRVYPHELSGGLRQRVMAAIAVGGRPGLIVADEPTTALDVTVQAQLLDLLRELRADFGCSVLLITHDLGVADQIADRLAVLHNGELVEIGPAAASVVRNPQHDYTRSLLASRLTLTMPRDERFSGAADDPSPRCGSATCAARSRCAGAGAGRAAATGTINAVDGVDLDIAPGEALAIVGESGSGKSTLLRIVAGLDKPTSGSVTLTGTGGPQMVFQDAGSSLTPWLSVGETLGERLRGLKLSRAEVRERVNAALAAVDLPPEVAKARPGELSGGQRQRVVLARATMIPPAVLLCDEPTSALDASLAKSVLALIRDLRARIGMTVLFVTHDLAVARLMGDRIAVMQAGRVVELGSCGAGDRRAPRGRTPAPCWPRCPRSPSREPPHDRRTLVARGRLRPVSVGGARLRRPMAWALVGLLALVTLVAVFARQLAPYNPIQPVGPLNLPPLSPGHLLGTDGIGRDLLSRTLIGIQVSWLSALVVVASGLLIGGTIGLIAGATGGWVDSVLLMRVTDLFLALPGALVAIAIVAALGSGLVNTLIGVALVWWPYYARIVRGETKALAARPHVEAARLAGVGRPRILTRHLLPGVVPTAVVSASLDIGNVVLLLAALSFLGLGQRAPAPELGADTARALSQLLSQWWVPGIPGIAVLLLSLIANVGGDAIRNLIPVRR